MLNGVVVDELTSQFLEMATDAERSRDVSQTLRAFFHDARNRLNSLKIGLYLARRGAAEGQTALWTELDQSYRGLEQLIDRLQMISRPLELSLISGDLGPWLDERRPIWSSKLDGFGRRLDWAPPTSPALGRFDPMRLIQGLDALVTWRAGEGARDEPARLAWGGDTTHLRLEWSEETSRLHEPMEGREGRTVSLALPLLAHVMTAHGGSLSVAGRGGLLIRLTWPIVAVEPQ